MPIQNAIQPVESTSITTLSSKWTRDIFTADEVLDAYLVGREHGRIEETTISLEKLKKGLFKAFDISEEVYSAIKSRFNMNPLGMKMRINSISSFNVLIIISSEDFVSDEIEKVYDFLLEEMKTVNKDDNFYWSFILMPFREGLDEVAISSDGYTLKYAPSK